MPVAALWPLPPAPAAYVPSARLPAYDEDDFLAATQGLLPSGPAWPHDEDANQTGFWRGVARARARQHGRENGVLDEIYPATTFQLLAEWEASAGLPDPCFGTLPTIEARRTLLLQRLLGPRRSEGSQSIDVLIDAAADLGITVTVTEYADAAIGALSCGDPLNGTRPSEPKSWLSIGDGIGLPLADWSSFTAAIDWAFALLITAVVEPTHYLSIGDGIGSPLAEWSQNGVTSVVDLAIGDPIGRPLRQWGSPLLECTLRRLAPAQAILNFAYSG